MSTDRLDRNGEPMTIDRLRAFRKIQKDVEEMQRELDTLYFPITSPNGRMGMPSSTGPGDPTASAFHKIERTKQKLIAYQDKLADELDIIEEWTFTLEDHELAAIIRAHYLSGDPWKRCTQRILNYEFSDTAKKRVYRYFGLIE